jgi:hypothetical protein
MKSFNLVATGIAILMCTILVSIKTNTGSIEQKMQETPAAQQEIAGQPTCGEDGLFVYPSCLLATLPYQ